MGTKSTLIECLEEKVVDYQHPERPEVDAHVVDGAAVINMLKPLNTGTFEEYGRSVVIPYIENQLRSTQRFDRYFSRSLKNSTRKKKGVGIRRRVSSNTKIPGDWQSFLRNEDHKRELFSFLAETVRNIQLDNKIIIATKENEVVSNSENIYFSNLMPCNHEEADSRIFLHISDIAECGVAIRIVDTDVVVLAISVFSTVSLDELWIAFGTGKSFRYIAVHEIARALGEVRSKALPFPTLLLVVTRFHFLEGRGKRAAWNTWNTFDAVTEVFVEFSKPIKSMSEESERLVERFVILLYDRTSSDEDVNNCRRNLLRKGRLIENIPPTKGALKEHIQRVLYQAG